MVAGAMMQAAAPHQPHSGKVISEIPTKNLKSGVGWKDLRPVAADQPDGKKCGG